MYIKALIEAFHDLRPGASSLAYKEVQRVVTTFGIGDKDQLSIFGVVREVIKSPQETAKEFLQQVAHTEPRMLEFVLDKVQEIEQSSKDITLDQALFTTVDRFVRMQEAVVGPLIPSIP
jgi:hypothetical protein